MKVDADSEQSRRGTMLLLCNNTLVTVTQFTQCLSARLSRRCTIVP